METLTWLFFSMSFTFGAFMGYKACKLVYRKKIKNAAGKKIQQK
jgi:hypothetical protein